MISRSAETSPLTDETPPPSARAQSRIDAQTTIDGTVTTRDDLLVEGRATGAINCGGALYVAEGAEVDATVEAGAVVVAGVLGGTIRCNGRLEIRPTGIVRARVDTARLVILEGGIYEGQLRMGAPAPELAEPAAADEAGSADEDAAEPTLPAPTAYSFLRSFTTPPSPADQNDHVPAPDDADEEP
jgi:cytoskeletal protein CcmA (bactofilin family)